MFRRGSFNDFYIEGVIDGIHASLSKDSKTFCNFRTNYSELFRNKSKYAAMIGLKDLKARKNLRVVNAEFQ